MSSDDRYEIGRWYAHSYLDGPPGMSRYAGGGRWEQPGYAHDIAMMNPEEWTTGPVPVPDECLPAECCDGRALSPLRTASTDVRVARLSDELDEIRHSLPWHARLLARLLTRRPR